MHHSTQHTQCTDSVRGAWKKHGGAMEESGTAGVCLGSVSSGPVCLERPIRPYQKAHHSKRLKNDFTSEWAAGQLARSEVHHSRADIGTRGAPKPLGL